MLKQSKKFYQIISLGFICINCHGFPSIISDDMHPYAKIAGGLTWRKIDNSQIIFYSPLYWKRAISSNDFRFSNLLAIGLGEQIPLTTRLSAELGILYQQTQSTTFAGVIHQYNLPQFYNLNYRFNVLHYSLMAEGKILLQHTSIYHPFINLILGIARNVSYAYQELPVQSYAVPDSPFTSATTTSFSYGIGIGMDIDIAQHWRIGATYQFENIGRVKLNSPVDQSTTQGFTIGSIYAYQLMLEAIYLM